MSNNFIDNATPKFQISLLNDAEKNQLLGYNFYNFTISGKATKKEQN